MPTRLPIDVVVVAGPGDEPAACARRIEALGGFATLSIVDARGRGFGAAANDGIAAGSNDVVVVEASVIVAPGWLERLARCLAADESIGLVVPFSSGDGPCALPGVACTVEDAERTAEAAAAAAVPLHPDVEIAGGPCAALRRAMLRRAGAFDDARTDAAAAIADLAHRARRAGFRTVLCEDAFVAGPPGRGAADAGDRPLRALRAAALSQRALLSTREAPGVLHVLHARGGGTEKHVRDVVAATGPRFRHYFLRILDDRLRVVDPLGAVPGGYDFRWRLAGADAASCYDFARHPGDDRWLAEICAWLRIALVHVHSLVGSGEEIARAVQRSGLPWCYTPHDMYLPCPTIHLIDARGDYCDATTDVPACTRCLAALGGYEDVDIARWRERYRPFVAGAARVLAPSRWAGDTFSAYFPDARIVVAAPPAIAIADDGGEPSIPFDNPRDERRHVALLGAIGPEKGARHLDALVARIRERALPLRAVVVGYTDREMRGQSADGVLTIHGPYRPGEIARLLDHYRIDVVLFPTVWPETWSYTLGEAWAAGRPALVPPRGALAERVLTTGAGWLLEGFPDADAMLDQVLAVTAPANHAALETAASRARAAAQARGEDDAIAQQWDAAIGEAGPRAPIDVSRLRIHEAASRAAGTRPYAAPRQGGTRPRPKGTPLRRLFGRRA